MSNSLTKLSLEEKIKLLVGQKGECMKSEGLDGKAYSIQMSDGPIGPHYPTPLLWLPSITCLSNTWNVDIVKQYVEALSDICVLNNVDMLLAPAINIKKNPLCGRNFEYFSEDPFLTGVLARQYVSTLQSRGVSCCIKHFAANNREYARLQCSSNMDERTLREIYTKAFEMVMDANPWALMCSYNKINGEYVSENEHILKDVLRNSLHFNNVIVSDWGAVHDRGRSLKASLDLEMPYPEWYDPYESIREGLKTGLITEKDIDDSVQRLETLINRIASTKKDRVIKYTNEERHEIAKQICLEGAVLLKNKDDILPLKDGQKIAVVGYHAANPELGGGGSCNLADDPFKDFDHRFDVIQKPLHELLKQSFKQSDVKYVSGYECHAGFGHHYRLFGNLSVDNIVKDSDVAVVVVGTNRAIECEGYDRENLQLDSIQLDVIKQVRGLTKNVIVVIESGGVVDVTPFEEDVKAILYMPFGGEATNEALTSLLTGEVSPSGKLTETFIRDISINPYIHERDMNNEEYDDRIYVGYRLYETKNIDVTYPFGYGLSYTQFKYNNLKVIESGDELLVCFEITNIGNCVSKEIAELYLDGTKAFEDRPVKELVGFVKVELKPGETKAVTIKLDNRSFAYFDEKSNTWKVAKGEYNLLIGASVKDIRLHTKIKK